MNGHRYRLINLAIAGVLVTALAGLTLLELATDDETLLLPGGGRVPELCLVKRTTGRPCPSCGVGRSLVLAVHGSAAESLRHHAGGVLLLAWMLLQGLWRVVAVLCAKRLARWATMDLVANSALVLFIFGLIAALGHW